MNTTPALRPFLPLVVAAFLAPAALAAPLPGSVDPAFAPQLDPAVGAPVQAVAVDTEGRILVAQANAVVRLLADGTRDASFGNQAKGNDAVGVLAPMPDGRICVGGRFTAFAGQPYQGLVRLNPDGTLDPTLPPVSLGGGGSVASVAPTADGRLIVGGTFLLWNTHQVVGLVRIGADGTYDPAFAENSRPIWGGTTSVTTRYTNINSVLVPITTTNIHYHWPPPTWGTVSRLMPRPDGGWFVGPVAVADLDSEGVPRRIIPPDSGTEGSYSGPCLDLPGGRILCAESIPGGGQPPRELLLHELDPVADWAETRTLRYACDGLVTALARLPDGSLVVGGRFSRLGGQRHDRLARLRPDGAVDSSFNPLVGTTADQVRLPHYDDLPYPDIAGILPQTGGSILVHGRFDAVGSVPVPGLARLFGGEAPPSAPVLGATPATVAWTEDEVAALGILVHSALPVTATWTRDGVAIPGATNAVLDLDPARLGHSGLYQLHVANDLGAAVGAPLRVEVGVGPSHPGTLDRSYHSPVPSEDRQTAYAGQCVAGARHYVFGRFRNPDGHPTAGMMRLLREGQVDPGFVMLRGDPDAALLRRVEEAVARSSGGLLVIAEFDRAVFTPEKPVHRLLALREDGSVDPGYPAFLPGQNPIAFLQELLPMPDGGALIIGSFGPTLSLRQVVKLLPDGQFDPAFEPVTNDVSSTIHLAAQSDGRFLLVSGDGASSGASRFRRFRPNGQPDSGFPVHPGGTEHLTLRSLVVDAHDRLLVGGVAFPGSLASPLVRLLSSGEPDPSFRLALRSDPPHRVAVDNLVIDDRERVLFRASSVDSSPPYLQAGPLVRLLPDGLEDDSFTTLLQITEGLPRQVGIDAVGQVIAVVEPIASTGPVLRRFNLADERRLDAPAVVDGRFAATLNTRTGRRYQVETADRLGAPPADWRTLRVIDGDGLPWRFVDPESIPRFYRLRLSDSPGH